MLEEIQVQIYAVIAVTLGIICRGLFYDGSKKEIISQVLFADILLIILFILKGFGMLDWFKISFD